MWSLGVVLYILLCGFPPFYGDEDEEMFELIRRATYAFPEDIDGYQTTWGGISAQAKGLIRQLLCVDPRERLSAAASLEKTAIALGALTEPADPLSAPAE